MPRFTENCRNKYGKDNKPDNLKVMMTALERDLKQKGHTNSEMRDRQFSSSKQVLDGKAKKLRLAGRGKRPNKAR